LPRCRTRCSVHRPCAFSSTLVSRLFQITNVRVFSLENSHPSLSLSLTSSASSYRFPGIGYFFFLQANSQRPLALSSRPWSSPRPPARRTSPSLPAELLRRRFPADRAQLPLSSPFPCACSLGTQPWPSEPLPAFHFSSAARLASAHCGWRVSLPGAARRAVRSPSSIAIAAPCSEPLPLLGSRFSAQLAPALLSRRSPALPSVCRAQPAFLLDARSALPSPCAPWYPGFS
jgi:hypothetical protein